MRCAAAPHWPPPVSPRPHRQKWSRPLALRCRSAHINTMRPEEVKAVRYKLKQTQADFALMIGVSVNTLQSWEEGRHRPDGPAEALLRVAAKSPKMVARVLGRA